MDAEVVQCDLLGHDQLHVLPLAEPDVGLTAYGEKGVGLVGVVR